jgi:ribokinase
MKRLAVVDRSTWTWWFGWIGFPAPGETRTGERFQVVPGGKGANQAVALGRLGADVTNGWHGGHDDASGEAYLKNFRENGVGVGALGVTSGETTGTAVIEVERGGENHIVIVPGANALCDGDGCRVTLPRIMDRDIFLFQLEIPHATVFSGRCGF